MASTLLSSSNITFITRSPQRNSPGERSRSKRLYTFIHYEHSIHPRRFIILFFLIIFVSLAFAWLIAGLIRLRQTASYLQPCATGKGQCLSGRNLTCTLPLLLCLCPKLTFWDNNQQKCVTVKHINETCFENDQCNSNQGLICSTNRTCQCAQNTYYTIASCVTYSLFGASCLPALGAPPCNTQLGLICDVGTQTCLCPPSTFWSFAECASVSTYGDYCDQNNSCNTQLGLFCRLPGTYPACDCPLQSKLYTCDCMPGQTWITATSINSTSSCVYHGSYSNNCTSNSQCSQTLNLVCIDNVCQCALPLWFWSWTTNHCLPCESQGYILIHYSSQWVCTRLISSSLMTYTASQLACTTIGWSLISPIFASDITVIAQAYPTYRLWINIQTSLNSSNYINNIFPNNQSNWNIYVSSSFTAVYSTYLYALQIVSSYSQTMLFEGNTNLDRGHALCALY